MNDSIVTTSLQLKYLYSHDGMEQHACDCRVILLFLMDDQGASQCLGEGQLKLKMLPNIGFIGGFHPITTPYSHSLMNKVQKFRDFCPTKAQCNLKVLPEDQKSGGKPSSLVLAVKRCAVVDTRTSVHVRACPVQAKVLDCDCTAGTRPQQNDISGPHTRAVYSLSVL